MNDTQLEQNFYTACYHYAKQIDPNVLSDFVTLKKEAGQTSIIAWNHNSTQPSNEDLKAFSTITVQQTWAEKRNDDEFALINDFYKYYLRILLKDIEILKGNPLPTDEDLNNMMRTEYTNWKNSL